MKRPASITGAQKTTSVQSARSVRLVPTPKLVSSPADLARYLQSLGVEIDSLRDTLASPFAGAVIVQQLAFTGGSARYVTHGLGRVPTGWLCVRSVTAAWAGYELAIGPHDPTQEIRLQTATTGTFDLLVF